MASMETLSGGGMPVGLLPDIRYEQFDFMLEPGDTLVVVSDGIVEACNAADEFWDEHEVERVLLQNPDHSVDEIPKLLCDAVDRYAAGAEQFDDMTVVALRVESRI